MNILLYPGFIDNEDLTDLYFRCCWYLPEMSDTNIVFPCKKNNLQINSRPDYFGDIPEPSFSHQIVYYEDNNALLKLYRQCDLVLIWNDKLNKIEQHNLGSSTKRKLNIDRSSETSRYEAYHFAILRYEVMTSVEKDELLQYNKQKLLDCLDLLKTEKSYIFGTGPSLEECYEIDFSDGLGIVCNAIVKNKKLLEHIKPQIITATDPALHFGISLYASEFRKELEETIERYNAYFFTDLFYYPLYCRHYPHLKDRIIGVPHLPPKIENISIDLSESFHIACYANVLTLFLIPLGTTFSEQINICGCDGKKTSILAPNNPSPFWDHHKASEFESVYDTLKICHPSFFMLDYKEWYDDHCSNVKKLMDKGLEKGKTFRSETTTYIPALIENLSESKKQNVLLQISEAERQAEKSEFSIYDDSRNLLRYKVSIILSIYNADKFITPALLNLINQSYYTSNKVEIIIIDSNSPGNEYRILQPILDKYNNIVYARTVDREPLYQAWNRAIPICRGEYVMNFDVDNRIRFDAVEIFSKYLDEHQDVGVVYGNQYVCYHENQCFSNFVSFGYLDRPNYTRSMMLHKFYFGSEMMWRHNLYDKVGLYDDSYIVAGDYEMACRMATVTDFAHIDVYFGLYLKNLNGIEYSNLDLCDSEDERIKEQFKDKFPKAIDPPRVHIHYPMNKETPGDYITIVCQTNSFDGDVKTYLEKLSFDLEYPHIIYSLDFCSAPETRQTLNDLIAAGIISDGSQLSYGFREYFDKNIAYEPQIKFFVVAFGEGVAFRKDDILSDRSTLTQKIVTLHKELTSRFKTNSGSYNLSKIPQLIDVNESNRLNLQEHKELIGRSGQNQVGEYDITIIIQHFCPEGQEDTFGKVLKNNIEKIRAQEGNYKIFIIVTDDGSKYTKKLGPRFDEFGIQINEKNDLEEAGIELDVNLYLYKNRTGFFSKGLLWEQARTLAPTNNLIFMDDDQLFYDNYAVSHYMKYLEKYQLVIGNTTQYRFFNHEDNTIKNLSLGYESRVVQGSNFAVSNKLLDQIGGFSERSFWWGKGDDPEIFWKLYLHLKPITPSDELQAVYVDSIRTVNTLSGRWQTNCKVSNEIFVKDFLRLYGVNPYYNESRDRISWVKHVKDELYSHSPTLDSNNITQLHIILNKPSEMTFANLRNNLENEIPLQIGKVNSVSPKSKANYDFLDIEINSNLSNLIIDDHSHTMLLPENTVLHENAFNTIYDIIVNDDPDFIILGSQIRNDSGIKDLLIPNRLQYDQVYKLIEHLMPGIPVVVKNTMKNLHGTDELSIIIQAFKQSQTYISTEVLATVSSEKTEELNNEALVAELLQNNFNFGEISKLLKNNGANLTKEKSTRDWLAISTQKVNIIQRTLDWLSKKFKSIALYGAGKHTLNLINNYFPVEGLELVCIIDDFCATKELLGVSVLSPHDYKENKQAEAVLISSDSIENKLFENAIKANISPVFRIYNSGLHNYPMWKALERKLKENCINNIVLYGAGAHTNLLLTHADLHNNFSIKAVIDDSPKAKEILGIPIIKPEVLSSVKEFDAIVISSDSIEKKLYEKASKISGLPIYSIYDLSLECAFTNKLLKTLNYLNNNFNQVILYGDKEDIDNFLKYIKKYSQLNILSIFSSETHFDSSVTPVYPLEEFTADKNVPILILSEKTENSYYQNISVQTPSNPIFTIRDNTVKRLLHWEKLVKKLTDQGLEKIALYGAGQHTKKLLILNKFFNTQNIVCIVDDFSNETELDGLRVLKPSEINSIDHDVVVISSDSKEKELYQQASSTLNDRIETIYYPKKNYE